MECGHQFSFVRSIVRFFRKSHPVKPNESKMEPSAFELLKMACVPRQSYKSIKEVRYGDTHIDEFKMMNTKNGPRILLLIRRELVFLPSRFAEFITTQEQIDELNKKHFIMTKDHSFDGQIVLHFREAFKPEDEID